MSRIRWVASVSMLVFGLGKAAVGLGQGTPFAGQITPTQPFTVQTHEIDQVLVTPLATGLANPFDMAFRGNGDILITERYTGKLRVVRDGRLLRDDLAGLPEVYSDVFRAGLMAVAVHPDDDSIVYLTYTKPIIVDGEPEQTVALLRARIVEDTLTQVEEIFSAKGLDRGIAASQLLFTPEGKLLMSIGGAYVYTRLWRLRPGPGRAFRQIAAPERRWFGPGGQSFSHRRRISARSL